MAGFAFYFTKRFQVMCRATQIKMFLQKAKIQNKTKMKKGGVIFFCKNILFCVERHITWNLFVK
jgi:hypothetical protein